MRLLILASLFFISCQRVQGFSLKKITSRTPTQEEHIGDELESIQALFDAPLTYIGSGNHTYAFVCADRSHVVKFFKQNHFGPYTWLDYLPLPEKLNPWRIPRKKAFATSRREAFGSLELAKKHLKDQTGLIYLHLCRTNNIKRKTKLIYSETRQPICNIDKMEFIVQNYAKVGFKHIHDLLDAGKKEEAMSHLASYLKLIRQRCEKGLADRDLQFFKNFGFVGDKPIEIDITDFCQKHAMKDKDNWAKEVKAASRELIDFVQNECPDLLDQFKEKIEEIFK